MARQSKYGPRVEYSGPFFEKDIRKTFRQNARTLVLQIAEDAEKLIEGELNQHRGPDAPHIADHIEARAQALTGKKWALTAVASSQLHLQLPGHKGYATVLETGDRQGRAWGRALWVFRRVGSAIKRTSRTARADLTKGLN